MGKQVSRDSKVTGPWIALVTMVALGLVLRLLYVSQIESAPFSDMADYETVALNLLEGRGLIMSDLYKAYRPPGYPLLIAAVYKVAGTDPQNIRVVQCLLSSASVVLLYLLVYSLFMLPTRGTPDGDSEPDQPPPSDEKVSSEKRASYTALMSSAFFCFEETSIFFCGQLLTETLFIFGMLLWSFLLVRTVSKPTFGSATLIGVLSGFLILIRPIFFPLVVLGAIWFYHHSRRFFDPPAKSWHSFHLMDSPYAPPMLMICYALLVVSFWGMRNQVVLGRFVPVSTNSGINFYLGHHEGFGYASFGVKEDIRQYLRNRGINDEVEESLVFTQLGMSYIREHRQEVFRNTLAKLYYLFLAPADLKSALNPMKWWTYVESPYRPWPWESQDRRIRFFRIQDGEGHTLLPSYRKWFWQEGRLPLISWGWPMIILSVTGLIWSAKRREPIDLIVLIGIVYTLVLLVFFTNARFRTPLLPYMYVFAGYTVVALLGKWFGSTKVVAFADPEPEPENPED